jgi:hypothetical protein
MRELQGLYFNNVNGSIGWLLEQSPRIITDFQYVLVTSLDSMRDMRKSANEVGTLSANCSGETGIVGQSLVVPAGLLLELMEKHSWFTGSDEVWCFVEKPSATAPDGFTIVGPAVVREYMPDRLREWMVMSRCVLGLGDGIGMNYVTTSREIALQLEIACPGDEGK